MSQRYSSVKTVQGGKGMTLLELFKVGLKGSWGMPHGCHACCILVKLVLGDMAILQSQVGQELETGDCGQTKGMVIECPDVDWWDSGNELGFKG
jgi:hypothetical protein